MANDLEDVPLVHGRIYDPGHDELPTHADPRTECELLGAYQERLRAFVVQWKIAHPRSPAGLTNRRAWIAWAEMRAGTRFADAVYDTQRWSRA